MIEIAGFSSTLLRFSPPTLVSVGWSRALASLAFLVVAGVFTPVGAQFDNGYSHRREVDFADAEVIGGPHSNFPVLMAATLPDLRTVVNGGKVENTNGYDIIFTSDQDGIIQLAHEIEHYDAVTGAIIFWVRIESLAATTKVYMYYGNSNTVTFQGDVASAGVFGVWDDNFRGVWHLDEGTGDTNVDATSNTNDGTPQAGPPEAVPGKIGGALDFAVGGEGTRVDIPADASLDMTLYSNWMMSAWVKPTSFSDAKWPTAFAYYNHATLGLTVEEGPNGRIEHWRNDQSHLQSDNRAPRDVWSHIAIVRDPVTTRFYLNGLDDGSGASVTINSPGRPSSIGSTPSYPGGDDFIGLIDEVRVYSAPRAPQWIQTEYNNQSSPSTFYVIGTEDTRQLVDLAITKTVDNPTPIAGETITYTVTITNNGPDDATGVQVIDQLPVGITYASDTTSQGSYDSVTGIWMVGTVVNAASATLTIVTSVDAPFR